LSTRLVILLSALAALAPFTSFALAGPVNYAPNSQWEIFSGEGYDARENVAGAGVIGAMAVSGNTTGSNSIVLSVAATPNDLKVGDLVKVSGRDVDPALTAAPMRVTAIVANTSITVSAPLNGIPRISRPAIALPVNIGMRAGSMRTGDAADGWSKTTTLEVWREDNAINLAPGSTYALGVKKDIGSQEYLGTTNLDVTRFRGRTATFGAYVYQKVRGGSGTWRLFCNSAEGVITSASAPTQEGYVWLELPCNVSLQAPFFQVGVYFNGAADDTYYVANPVLALGASIGVNNYEKPAETLTPVNGIVPITWNNAKINFPTTARNSPHYYDIMFDAYAETGGQIAPSVISTDGQLEGVDAGAVQTGTGFVRAIGFRNNAVSPIVVGGILPQSVAKVKSFTTMNITLDGAGHAWANSGVPGDVWTNVALEFDRFHLK